MALQYEKSCSWQILENSCFFFLINVDNYIKWKPILWMQNSGFSIATRVYWSIWPQREGKCHFWGMCDILRSRNISINIWKCELWEVYLNFIKVYGQTLQNILEILHLYSKMKFFLSCFTKIKMKNKKDLDCFDWPSQSPDINIIKNIWLL